MQALAFTSPQAYSDFMKQHPTCLQCGARMPKFRNPAPTTDVIIYDEKLGIVLIERMNEPFGFALPGGFIDYGECAEHAAIREMREETSLEIELCGLLGVYSNPQRDARFHTMSIAFVATAKDISALSAGDDAKHAAFFKLNSLPPLAFDHAKIIHDFTLVLQKKRVLAPIEQL